MPSSRAWSWGIRKISVNYNILTENLRKEKVRASKKLLTDFNLKDGLGLDLIAKLLFFCSYCNNRLYIVLSIVLRAFYVLVFSVFD